MKNLFKAIPIILSLALISCSGEQTKNAESSQNWAVKTEAPANTSSNAPITAGIDGKIQHITTDQFVNGVNDFRNNKTFALKSELPCVVDFYADWCKPCKMIAPYIEELAAEYKGKVNFLKINVDNEPEIAKFYNIEAIPSLMFCTKKGEPKMEVGGMDKETINKKIQSYIFNK